MKKTISACGFLVILIFVASASAQAAKQQKTEIKSNPVAEELVAIEKKRSEAIAKHDADFLNKLYADDFRGVTAIGYEVTKENLMTVFKRDDPNTKFELDQLQARVFGDTAITTGRLVGKSAASGEIVHESKFMHVYVKRGGSWKLVAGQGTMIPSQPPTTVK